MRFLGKTIKWGLVFLLGVGAANACSADDTEAAPEPEVEVRTRVVEREVEVPVVETVERMPAACETLVQQAFTVLDLAGELSATQGEQLDITQEIRRALAGNDVAEIGRARSRQNDMEDEQLGIYQGLASMQLEMETSRCDIGGNK